MKKTATKKMTYGGAKTMKSGGKATAKPKMKVGGATPKKKYAMAGTTDGDPLGGGKGNCKMGKCGPNAAGMQLGKNRNKTFKKRKTGNVLQRIFG